MTGACLKKGKNQKHYTYPADEIWYRPNKKLYHTNLLGTSTAFVEAGV